MESSIHVLVAVIDVCFTTARRQNPQIWAAAALTSTVFSSVVHALFADVVFQDTTRKGIKNIEGIKRKNVSSKEKFQKTRHI